MSKLIGLILIVLGVVLGLWAGVWWAFIGGIVDVIREVRAQSLDGLSVAIGIAKIMCAGLIGAIAALCLMIPGYGLISSKSRL